MEPDGLPDCPQKLKSKHPGSHEETIAFTPLLILLLIPGYVYAQARNEIPMYAAPGNFE